MTRHFISSIGALALLCVLAAFTLPGHAAGQQEGMTVARDPQTGKLRAPTPEEARALQAQTPAGARSGATDRAPLRVSHSSGAHGVRLGEKSMVYEVATRDADGKLSSQCLQGDQAAHDALHRPAATAHQEHAYETR